MSEAGWSRLRMRTFFEYILPFYFDHLARSTISVVVSGSWTQEETRNRTRTRSRTRSLNPHPWKRVLKLGIPASLQPKWPGPIGSMLRKHNSLFTIDRQPLWPTLNALAFESIDQIAFEESNKYILFEQELGIFFIIIIYINNIKDTGMWSGFFPIECNT